MPNTSLLDKIQDSAFYLLKRIPQKPKVGIIFGSGLGGAWLEKHSAIEISYSEIPHYLKSTVLGHPGRLLFGKTGQISWVAAEGRFHFYEGYSMEEVVYPIRVFKSLGVDTLLLTNAAGGLNPKFKVGDFILISDHINFTGHHPLRGKNEEKLGPRFPEMSRAYDPHLIKSLLNSAQRLKIKVKKGIYIGISGPSYETGAEVKMFRKLGGDVVGMSTVPEVIAAAHLGLKTAVISCITNMLLPPSKAPLSHDRVLRNAKENQYKLYQILEDYLCNLK